MKSISIALVAALLAVGGGATAIALAAPAASETSADPCIAGPKDVVPCATWAVKCIGDALGGNACHGASAVATAASAESPVVDCVKRAVRDVLAGVTPMPCPAEARAAGPDVDAIVSCVGLAVRNILDGVTPEPCTVNAAAATSAESPVVDCVKRAVRDVLNGVTPMPCPVASESQLDPKKVAACVGYAVQQTISGNPIEPCDVSFAAANANADGGVVDYALCTVDGVRSLLKGQPSLYCQLAAEGAETEGPKEVVECAKKNVRDILQGTPQPCAV